MTNNLPSLETVLLDPSTSFWLRGALESALKRDPVDAANDAEVLDGILQQRARQQTRYEAEVSERSKHQMLKMEELRNK
jgi:hypothetical protein